MLRALVAAIALLAASLPALAGPDDLAVIIANKRYDNALAVEYADRDGEAMRDFAERVLAIPRDRIILVPDATLGRMRTLFGSATRPGEIAARLAGRKAQRVWVYYSGHGIPGKAADRAAYEPYLLPRDGNPGQPEHSAFALDELEAALRAAVATHARGAQAVLILDACFSGRSESPSRGEAKGSVLASESSAGGPVRFAPRPASEELIVLAAARDDEIASWDREARHGLFTDLLLQALFNGTGEGRRVTLGAIDGFIAARTNERLAALFPGGGRLQRPELRGPREVALVDNAGTIVRDADARLQATVLCNGLKFASDPKAIASFLTSALCARGCDEACRTALDARRRSLEGEAAECASLAHGLESLVKANQPKAVLEGALAGVPARCVDARALALAALKALDAPAPPAGQPRGGIGVPGALPPLPAPPDKDAVADPAAPAQQRPGALPPLPAPPKVAALAPPSAGDRKDPAVAVVPGSGQSFKDKLANGQDCAFCPKMVVVPAGSFVMGSPPEEIAALVKQSKFDHYNSEGPQRKVTIRQALAVGKFEVTFDEWDACVSADGCAHRPPDQGWGRGRRPVINVSWEDAKQYAAWLSDVTGKGYRLLTEAEWEYAARAGTTTQYHFGDSESGLDDHAWYSANSGEMTHSVGGKRANAWGLHDMHGNAWEWVEDCWHSNYSGAPADGSAWTTGWTETTRVLRGSSWYYLPLFLRSAYRRRLQPGIRGYDVGLRLARTIGP